jgi:hypothetical protein
LQWPCPPLTRLTRFRRWLAKAPYWLAGKLLNLGDLIDGGPT